jgi:hypothetical protein
MPTAPVALVCDFLEWLEAGRRSYGEAMDAWRTSCPRLTVWEDAIDEGFAVRVRGERETLVTATEKGRAWLRAHRRVAMA